LVYLGDLTSVFKNALNCLAPDGCFLFTVEKADGESYELGPKRRWRHGEAYLRRLAEQTGFTIAGFVAAAPRQEANQPVEGFAVALTR
jgi:predicted TPR repeat methyltransferase